MPRYFYLKEIKSGLEFPRAYYVANPNKTEEENKSNSKRVRALMLKVAKTLELDEATETNNAAILGEELTAGADGDCKGKNCIRLGAESKLIQEINIRLAGFGGNVPTKKFTPRTVTMIKQFQKDYMEIEPTGNICGDTLKAIDEFSDKFDVSSTIWGQLDCSCTGKGTKKHNKLNNKEEQNNCSGWGDKSGKNTYKSSSHTEAMHKYEYPGIHRSLLFGLKGLLFYMSKQTEYEFAHISSGYRCRFKQYKTTNHQGKAIDIQFNKGSWGIRGKQNKNLTELKEIRKRVFTKKLNAKTNWTDANHYSLEPIGMLSGKNTWSWIHMDVRKFDSDFLKDEFFCKEKSSLNGKKIVDIAKEEGFKNTCDCIGVYASQQGSNSSGPSTCFCFNQELVNSPCSNGTLIIEKHYEDVSKRLGIEIEVMKAIAKQESKRNSFWSDGQATILFERHKMWKYLKEDLGKTNSELNKLKQLHPKTINDSSGGYGKYSEQYTKLVTAKEIDYTSAIKSCSWGKFQVMGFNYAVAFDTPEQMEEAVNKCELQQFKLFVGYLENTSGLIQSMKDKKWETIAYKYNGSAWRSHNPNYANNIKKYYNEFKASN